jgi:hypothetical protein
VPGVSRSDRREPAIWCVILTHQDWTAEREELIKLRTEDEVAHGWPEGVEVGWQDDLEWLSGERRQRRIAEKDWPPWM